MRTFTDEHLRTKCKKVYSQKVRTDIANKMGEVYQGLEMAAGLAANQIGLPYRAIIVDGHIFFNPEITYYSPSLVLSEELCYSVSLDTSKKVKRSSIVEITYQDYWGNIRTTQEKGTSSTVFQHEIDHINGILMTDYEDLENT